MEKNKIPLPPLPGNDPTLFPGSIPQSQIDEGRYQGELKRLFLTYNPRRAKRGHPKSYFDVQVSVEVHVSKQRREQPSWLGPDFQSPVRLNAKRGDKVDIVIVHREPKTDSGSGSSVAMIEGLHPVQPEKVTGTEIGKVE